MRLSNLMFSRKTPKFFQVSLILSAIAPQAFAQTPPDAGVLQQQIERERAIELPKKIAPEKPVQPPPMRAPTGLVVTVKQFRFAGNTLLNSEQLSRTVAEFLDRPLDFNQLQTAAAAVAEAYRESGWVVRAYLPAQDIQDGVVTIQIVESLFGGTRLEGEPLRLKSGQVLDMVSAQQETGKPLNTDDLDRALLLANDLPGVNATGALAPGQQEGQTDLILKLTDEARLTGDVLVDNTGSRSTGAERLSASLELNSPLGRGDRVSANWIHTEGSDYGRVALNIPVGANGWRAGVSASRLDYELVGSEFATLNAEGSSENLGLEASYPVIRSRLKNLYLAVNYDHKKYHNQTTTTETRYSMDDLSLGLYGNLFDNLGGGGANSASVFLVSGSRDNDVGVTDADFTKLRYSLVRQQVLTSDWSLTASLSGQISGDGLDSSEKFYLGGAYGVRAYPTSEGGGDSGVLLGLEVRRRLPNGFSVSGFYDHGRIDNENGGLDYSLKGAGLAASWQSESGASVKMTWSHRIGDNPNPTSSGKDQDGSLTKNRFWLTASHTF